jgi:putative transposase
MPDKIVTFDEAAIKMKLSDLVRESVQETLNAILDDEADRLVGAERYERSAGREAYRSGHYKRKLTTKAGQMEIDVPKLKGVTFQTAVIDRYRRRETSVEEAMVEMYLAGVSTRGIEDVSEVLWGTKVSPSTVSKLNKQVYERIERWRSRPLSGEYPYVYVDGIYLEA